MYRKKLLIDLDGVLNQYSGKYEEKIIPPVKEGAREFLEELYNADYELVIFTTRDKLLAEKWLEENSLAGFITSVTNVKEPAFLVIDDRCICFNGDFKDTTDKINNFRAYWK